MTYRTLCCAVAIASASMSQGVDLPVLPDAIPASIARRRPDLPPVLIVLKRERVKTLDGVAAFKRTCEHVVVGSSADRQCEKNLPGLLAAAKADQVASAAFLADFETERRAQAVIDGVNALGKRLRWDDVELKRLAVAMDALKTDGLDIVTGAQVNAVWSAVRARGDGAELARAAAAGQGPDFLGSAHAGRQRFGDCAIFAISSASGEPYGVVAARAGEFIRNGEWRNAADRRAPEQAMKRGLIGGEVVMLAEAFGEVQVVESGAFQTTLQAGQSVMVNVYPQGVVFPADGGPVEGHQVTLTRTFQRGAETWFAMIDSNQEADKRSYVRQAELMTILQENGVAFRPNAKMIPRIPK